jgi:hypothetical protein
MPQERWLVICPVIGLVIGALMSLAIALATPTEPPALGASNEAFALALR